MIRRATVITDCHCGNATVRQSVAWSTLAGTDQPTITAIHGDIDGAGMLVDALVETRGSKWVVFCQSAPRDSSQKAGNNGSKFGYFWFGETLVLVSLDGHMLSLSKQLGLIKPETEVFSLDIPEVLTAMVAKHQISEGEATNICRSQFRSLKFAPRVAGWLLRRLQVPARVFPQSSIPDFGVRVWWVDNFGNCKTSLRISDIGYKEGKVLRTNLGDFPCIPDLRAVPNGQQAAVLGSSGLEGDEFIELVVQGVNSGSAAKRFGLEIGTGFEVIGCD